MRSRRAAYIALAVLIAVEALWAWPWSRDMIVQPILRPLLLMFGSAPGAVAIGSEPPRTREVAARELHNPLSPTPENLQAGKKLFDIYCAPCHGVSGQGNGPASTTALPAANLTSPLIQQQSDGMIYSTIRYGRLAMPEYQESLSPQERWQVILYVRTLGEHRPAAARLRRAEPPQP